MLLISMTMALLTLYGSFLIPLCLFACFMFSAALGRLAWSINNSFSLYFSRLFVSSLLYGLLTISARKVFVFGARLRPSFMFVFAIGMGAWNGIFYSSSSSLKLPSEDLGLTLRGTALLLLDASESLWSLISLGWVFGSSSVEDRLVSIAVVLS